MYSTKQKNRFVTASTICGMTGIAATVALVTGNIELVIVSAAVLIATIVYGGRV